MSSLGDLLLGKIPEPEDDVEKSEHDGNQIQDAGDREPQNIKQKLELQSPPDECSNDSASNGRYSNNNQRIFPDRIEKKPERLEDDRRSNASSTDDLVRELLDPNDRPRNVWHVVTEGEEPRSQSRDRDSDRGRAREEGQEEEEEGKDPRKERGRSENEDEDETDGRNGNNRDSGRRSERGHSASRDKRDDVDGDIIDRKEDDKTRDRGQDRGRDELDRHDKKRSRDHDKERERRDHRRRSPDGRHSKSRSKRSKYSDDEDEDRDYKRHRGSRGRRHDKRSRSRSLSRDSGSRRRRHRSRSNDSRSTVMKRDSKTILVMQLSPRVVSRDLEEFFEEIGRVKEVRLIMDSKTRRHKGIAYIEFESSTSVSKALTLNGQKFHGAPMQIQSTATDKSRGSGGGGDYNLAPTSSSHGSYHHHNQHSSSHTSSSHYPSSRSQLPPNSYRVYMGGLNVGITDEMLRTIVEPFGFVHKVEVIKDRTTGLSRGYAFVTYANAEDGQEAIRNLDGFELAGKLMRVSKSTEKSEHQTDRYSAK